VPPGGLSRRTGLLGPAGTGGGSRRRDAPATRTTGAGFMTKATLLNSRGRGIVITGGAGFIGSNLADALLSDGERVTILDNLSRDGVRQNVDWLKGRHGSRLKVAVADVRNASEIDPVLADATAVFHFAAQTAVTTSLLDP